MRSMILQVTSAFLLPGLVVFSLWVLLRGHHAPGGGFVGGLVAAAGFALRVFACGPKVARAELRVSPEMLIGVGLLATLVAGLVGLASSGAFLDARWLPKVPLLGALGTPLLFDLGVYLLVLGAVMAAILSLSETEH